MVRRGGASTERERGEIEMSAKKQLRWRQKHRLCQRQPGYHGERSERSERGREERSSRTRNTNPIRNLLRLPSGHKEEGRKGIIQIQTEARAGPRRPSPFRTDASLELYRTFRSLRSELGESQTLHNQNRPQQGEIRLIANLLIIC